MKVKNWSKFQHFKDRKPPWVKLYRDLLDDLDWHMLDGTSAKYLTMIWLIASESMGVLPSVSKLAFRLRISEKEMVNVLGNLTHWIDIDDINLISEGNQVDTPETETEAEKEERKSNAEQARLVFNFWQTTMKHERALFTTERKRIINKWLKAGYTCHQLKQAIAGCRLTDWNMGRGDNSNGTVYDGLHVIFKNADNIDRFIKTYESSRG